MLIMRVFGSVPKTAIEPESLPAPKSMTEPVIVPPLKESEPEEPIHSVTFTSSDLGL